MKVSDFTTYLREQVNNHSIYVWGAQGQKKPTITKEWIRKREKTKRNADRAIAHWEKEVRLGYGDVLRAFDCSGLGCYYFLKHDLIDHDLNADGLRKLSKRIDRNEVREGIATTAVLIGNRQVRAERNRCPCLLREIHGYLWDSKARDRGEERPVKDHDHAMDALRYLCHTRTTRFRRAGGHDA